MVRRFGLLSFFVAAVAAAQESPLRRIVELRTAPAKLDWDPARRQLALSEGAAQLRAEQDAFRSYAESRGVRVLGVVDTVLNAVIVEASALETARLPLLERVRRVYPVWNYHATTDRALLLHKVPEAWTRSGGMARAGAGIRVAVLDSGIDAGHPGFQDDSLAPPEGFPRADSASNLALATRKVIVARSYEELNGPQFGIGAADTFGHGTQAAFAAAGVQHPSPRGPLSGVAPKAFLGNYRVLSEKGGTNAGILKALDDAVKDGMDVVNLSLGSDLAVEPAADPLVQAIERVVAGGAIVVAAAGNAGPDANTIGSPATSPSAVSVGSSSSDRALAADGSLGPIDPNRMSDFSSRGPNAGAALKPDVVATGDNFFTAQTAAVSQGNSPYTITQGTSFAAPVVAGAAALLKGARPGLNPAQYASLLVNTATPMLLSSGQLSPVRDSGAGVLNVDAALAGAAAFAPVSLKFGVGGGTAELSRPLAITNLGQAAETYNLTVQAFDGRTQPVLSASTVTADAGQSVTVTARWNTAGLGEGEYQGFVAVANAAGTQSYRVPYWFAIPSTSAKAITLLEAPAAGAPGSEASFGVRVVDAAGLAVAGLAPQITGLSGGGSVTSVTANPDVPGAFDVRLRLGEAGDNVFRITAGEVRRDVTISAR